MATSCLGKIVIIEEVVYVFILKICMRHMFVGLDDSIEQWIVKIFIDKKCFVVGTTYRPPFHDISNYLSIFEDSLSTDADFIICSGDLNINLCDIDNSHVDNLYSILNSFNIRQIIDQPTCITMSTSTLIDLMTVSNNCDITESGTYNADLSDHQGRIPFFGIYDTDSIDRKVHILEDYLVKLFDIHAPQIVVRCAKPVAPWFTNVIKVMIKIRDNALRSFKKHRNNVKWEFYKKMRNNVNKAVEREKKAYMELKLRNCNYRERWRILKSNNIIPDKKASFLYRNICIINYLKDRQQRVVLNGFEWRIFSIHEYYSRSTPRFCVRSPVLVRTLRYAKLHLYADESQIYLSFKKDEVQTACNKINQDLNSFIN
nr:unnamed protein product [Callosobruchus analis]